MDKLSKKKIKMMDECMRDNYLNINFFNTTQQLLSNFEQ